MTTMSLPAQIARTRRFTLGVPGQFTVGPDGAEVLFLRTRAGDDPAGCLWALDLDSGTERLLADPARLLAAEPAEPTGPERVPGSAPTPPTRPPGWQPSPWPAGCGRWMWPTA